MPKKNPVAPTPNREARRHPERTPDELLAMPVQTIETTAILGLVSESTVKRAIRAGELPFRRVGRLVRIATPDALEWLGAAREAA